MDEIEWASATALLEAYAEKSLSPVEVAEYLLGRIEVLDDRTNAFCHLDQARTLAQAQESEARWMAGEPQGLLDGVPVTVKDLLLVEGWPTLRGSATLDPAGPAGAGWRETAPCVDRLREHGAVLLGKTTTPEFGWKAVTDSPLTGITRNPWNLDTSPGGSSGGASAALAAGMGPLGLGTDAGGSIRIPAGLTGVFGLKPTYGRVPAYPASPFGTLAHIGPMARTVTDAALLLQVIGGADTRDPTRLPEPATDYEAALETGLAGARIAWSPDLGYAKVAPEVIAVCEAGLDVLRAAGAEIVAADIPFTDPTEIFRPLYGAAAAHVLRATPEDKRGLMDEGLVAMASAGMGVSAGDYLAASIARTDFARAVDGFLETVDFLATPQLAVASVPVGRLAPEGWEGDAWMRWTPFTYPFNLSQNPAATIPCGFTGGNAPVALQLVGRRFADADVLAAARAFEREQSLFPRRPFA